MSLQFTSAPESIQTLSIVIEDGRTIDPYQQLPPLFVDLPDMLFKDN